MSLSKSLKRKVDVENRSFNESWTDKYAFILPTFRNAKPVCLICNEAVAVAKEYNLRRHHFTKHEQFKSLYPERSEARARKIAALKAGYSHARGIMSQASSEQERTTSASLKAVWILTKRNKPFTDTEVFKEVMISVLEELATDKSMDKIITSVKQIPLSAATAARRVHVLAEDVQRLQLDGVKKAQHISLAIDESTDHTDISQLCVFVRYFDGKDFREELLALIPLEGNTTGDIVFGKLKELFTKHGLSFEKINFIVTDGAPAMVGKNRGVVSRIKNVSPDTNALHCLIHQSVLCAKLNGDLKEVMDKTMKIINFIRTNSSTQHRLFRQFVHESEATQADLLLHNDVRWLSKGKALDRFIELRHQVVDFLKQSKSKAASDHLHTMQDREYMCNVAFLADIFSHLNTLNLQLQGNGKCVVDMVERLDAFGNKLGLFHTDLVSGKLLHFNSLKTVGMSKVTDNMKDFIIQLKQNFSDRFDDFAIPRDVMEFVRDPFTINPGGEFSANVQKLMLLNEAAVQCQLVDIQASSEMKAALRGAESLTTFWLACPQEYDALKTLAMYVLTMFGSTYTCESAFSKMNAIKTHERNRLSNHSLEDCLRISLTTVEPDIKKLVSEGNCHFSH